MILLTEEEVDRRLTPALAMAAVERALVAAADGSGRLNPVVIGGGLAEGQSYSIKSGASLRDGLVGLKVGSYWPGAERFGLARHGSSVLLLDAATGRLRAVVEASRMNGPRTAAANAAAAQRLARNDTATLAVLGAGHQAPHEIRALCSIRSFTRILLWSRTPGRAEALRDALAAESLPPIEIASAERCCREADLLVTVTNARAPLFDDGWIRPGTHVAAMGADQAGKQELPIALLERAALYCDLPSQSVLIGEFQHVRAAVENGRRRMTAIGEVLAGRSEGRRTWDEITVFDSSGLALQDLYVAQAVLDAA